MRVLIKNGILIDPANSKDGEFDLLLEDGKVLDIQSPGSFDKAEVKEVLDAQGLWVTPGLVDVHVHLREPGFEWKETIETGVQAAVLGGYTSVCSMPNTKPTNDSAEVTRFIRSKAEAAGLARVWPIGSVTVGLEGKQMAPLSELREAGCIAFSDDGEPVAHSGIMRRALEWASMLDATICCHEEDKHLSCGGSMNESALSSKLGLVGWPKIAEEVMIARDIELARATGGKAHICHVSTARGVELIRRAKNDGIAVTCEVTPHHLHLTEDAVGDYDTRAKMSPPLRQEEDCEALRLGLKDGTIDCIASDHAPHEKDIKDVEFSKAAFGILGLQTSLPLILEYVASGLISRQLAVALLSEKPAKSLGMEVGNLRKGAMADLVLIDPSEKWSFELDNNASRSINSPFFGRSLIGRAQTVLVGGKVVVRDKKLVDKR